MVVDAVLMAMGSSSWPLLHSSYKLKSMFKYLGTLPQPCLIIWVPILECKATYKRAGVRIWSDCTGLKAVLMFALEELGLASDLQK